LGGGIIGLVDFSRWLGEMVPGADYKVCVFEENSGNHAVRRALGHAHAINELERLCETVPIVCAANCLQPYRQNDNDWNQGFLFLSPSQVWGQPPYYVTQMVSEGRLPLLVEAQCESPNDALDVTARRSEDGKTIRLQVVNLEEAEVPARIGFEGAGRLHPKVRARVLRGPLDDVNTPEEPDRIVPHSEDLDCQPEDRAMRHAFPGHSFTTLDFSCE